VVSQQNADTLHLTDVTMATTLALSIWGAHWCHLVNTTEPSMCASNAELCEITLTTCYYYYKCKVCKVRDSASYVVLH